MAPRLSKLLCLALLAYAASVDGRRGYVDRHRQLQDLNMEEEVGSFGHEETVIIAHEEDSTTAKATSRVHNPDGVNSKKADIDSKKAEQFWSEEEIQKNKEEMKKQADAKAKSEAKAKADKEKSKEEGAEGGDEDKLDAADVQ